MSALYHEAAPVKDCRTKSFDPLQAPAPWHLLPADETQPSQHPIQLKSRLVQLLRGRGELNKTPMGQVMGVTLLTDLRST